MTGDFVYLHGFSSGPSSRKARFFAEKLQQAGARVAVPDLTRDDFENLTITGQLEVIEEVAAGRPVSLIGSSMGGYLAAIYAACHPEIARLMLMAPAFGFLKRWPQGLGPNKMNEWRESGELEVFNYADQRMRKLKYGLIADGAKYEEYPDFHQPALIFHGINDDVVPVENSRQFAASHSAARLVEFESGHELTDVMDRMWDEARGFLLR
jgi:pimeloyl-ACP methyl ester carboxylesterase